MEKYDVIVVGAGAAGLIAAGRAAEKGANVLVLEKMRKAGRKVLITGKGRCNITNNLTVAEFVEGVFPNGRFLRNVFSQFYNAEVLQLLEKYGVESVLERGGRYFPKNKMAKDVVEALLKYNEEFGVEIRYESPAEELWVKDNQIIGVQCDTRKIYASKVIVATGGKSYPATGSTGDGYTLASQVGHRIEKPRAALVPLVSDSKMPARLTELTLKNVKVMVWVDQKKAAEEFGEMTFIPDGLAGPVILTLSRMVVAMLKKSNQVEISIDLKPALDDQKLDKRLIRDLNENPKKKFRTVFITWLPSALVPVIMDRLKIDGDKECHQVTAVERKEIRKVFKYLPFNIIGHRPWDEAIITAGGVLTRDISPKTMESKLVKGLFFAGEVIDLDGPTGGYNLQIAWSTGWVAGDWAAAGKS